MISNFESGQQPTEFIDEVSQTLPSMVTAWLFIFQMAPLSKIPSGRSKGVHPMHVIIVIMASHVTAQHADTPITAPSVKTYIGQKTAP